MGKVKSDITISVLREQGKRICGGVLALGEVTGHKHVILESEGYERYELGGARYLVVTAQGGVSISHEEHGVGVIEPGIYEERIDREYDYAEEMSRAVED